MNRGHTGAWVAGAVAAAVTPLLWVAPAGGQSSMTVSPPSTVPGGTVTFSGTVSVAGAASCPSGDPAQLSSTAALFPPDGFGPQAARDPSGAFRISYTIPAATPPGTYTIVVRCGGANTGTAATLQVTAATSTTIGSSITVVPPSAAPNGTVTISGTVSGSGAASCPSGDPAQLTSTAALFPPDGFGPQAARDPSGAFRVSYTIPANTPAGAYTIVVRCGGGNTGIAATLRVAPATPTTTIAPAPAKGTSRTGWVVLGAALGAVILGVAALLVRRRRRR